jgi:hypothetical protein
VTGLIATVIGTVHCVNQMARRKWLIQNRLGRGRFEKRRARDSNPQPLAGHHISSCTDLLSANVQERPKPYTVAGLGRLVESANIRQCVGMSVPLATNWLHKGRVEALSIGPSGGLLVFAEVDATAGPDTSQKLRAYGRSFPPQPTHGVRGLSLSHSELG